MTTARAPLKQIEAALNRAGLAGQVHVGIRPEPPLPTRDRMPRTAPDPASFPAPREGRAGIPEHAGRPEPGHPDGQLRPGAEEVGFPLDGLLRPDERPDRGRLIELSGEPSSGRTALAYRLVAGATAGGELAGWVDLPDALDPRFLRRSGAVLERLLWARPPHARAALRAAELITKSGFAVIVLDLLGSSPHELERLGTAAWSRLLRAVRGARATLAVLGPQRVAGAFSTLGIHTERCSPWFERGLFEGLVGNARLVRNRSGPAQGECAFRVLHRPSVT